MDSRLVMVVVMVAVACLSPGAKAQNTTSAMNVTAAATASVSEGPSTAPGATGVPTTAPGAPTGAPTTAPGAPTGAPTTAPGALTGAPTTAPSATGAPTAAPGAPTGAPTTAPGAPTGAPTPAPSVTGAPTTAPGAPTTAPGAPTGAPTTAPSATGAPTTAPGATGVPTTAPGATGVPTTAPGAPTTAPGATGAPTTAPGAPTTAPGAPTTAPGTTGAPTTIQTTTPFVSNGTVDTLTTNITRDSCRKTQFCASEPSSCSLSSDSCYFVSAAQASGQAFSFQLNGPSTGYIAMGLASSAAQSSNITTYVCANRNGIFKFFTTYLNNGQLMMTTLPVNKVKGSVRGKLLQCAFTALLPSVTSKSADTRFIVSMSNGNFNNDTLGTPVVQLRSSEAVDLSNPNTTVTNSLNATSAPTTVATTANHGITLQRSLSQALLILFGVLGMALL